MKQSALYGNIQLFYKNEAKVAILLEHKDSKSFLSILVLMCRCILYPGAKLFVTSGGKEQSAGIIQEKVNELCSLVPALKKEIDWTRGQTLASKDYCIYKFKSGSYFDNIVAAERSRGKRRHGEINFMTLPWSFFI